MAIPIPDPDDLADLASSLFESSVDAAAGFVGPVSDIVNEVLSDPSITDYASGDSLKFGSYPSEIDSSYKPIVDAQGDAYLYPSDYVSGTNKYVPK
jgi:hypothetical protein